MNIRKLPSGSYQIREMYKGKNYTLTVKTKPTKREAEMLINEKIGIVENIETKKPFYDCAYDYTEIKQNVLSVTTIKAYKSLLRNAFPDWFLKKDISEITNEDIQIVINTYAANHSPKTVRNLSGLISAIFAIYKPSMDICPTLPQKAKNDAYMPTSEDVKRIFEYAKDTEYEIGLKLCAMGLRRSEMCALTIDDLDGNTLTINKALVLDENNNWILKKTKTTDSTRKIQIPHELAAKIRENGFVYGLYPNSIYIYLRRTQKKLGIPYFSLHKLRHFFASNAHALGIPDVYIMQAGGWKTDATLKSVYRHALSDKSKEMQKKIADSMSALY